MSENKHSIRFTQPYAAIKKFYGERRAERSGVLLMDHIHQGVAILDALDAPLYVACAYVLHPLFQADAELTTVGMSYLGVGKPNPYELMLAMEYRNQANKFLSDKIEARIEYGAKVHVYPNGMPTPGPLPEVRLMLIADKVQNYKDFLLHHHGRHARSEELDYYFKLWLQILGVDQAEFTRLAKIAEAA